MQYTVSSVDLNKIHLGENVEINAILQNIAIILATPKGTVPMYRDFGLDWTCLDKPTPVAKVRMISRVREAIEQWEPRATVLNVSFLEDAANPGVLIPTVEVEIVA